MTENRPVDYLEHIRQAASDACGFIQGMGKDEFLADKRTQSAVVMSLVIIGEAATQLMDHHPALVAQHPGVPWRSMRGMRNRIAHGYFDIDLDIVWETVRAALPSLLDRLSAVRNDADRQA